MDEYQRKQPERVSLECLLCPDGQHVTIDRPGSVVLPLVNEWLAHVEQAHPDDALVARDARMRMEKFVDGIGDSAAQHRLYVSGDRLLAREIWARGILALRDDREAQDAWVKKNLSRRDQQAYMERRKQDEARLERLAQGLVHRYRITFESRERCQEALNLMRMSGHICGYRPAHRVMLVEDPQSTALAALAGLGTVEEVPVDTTL